MSNRRFVRLVIPPKRISFFHFSHPCILFFCFVCLLSITKNRIQVMNSRHPAKRKRKNINKATKGVYRSIQLCMDQQKFSTFYQLDVKESPHLEIHFVQLNLFKLFLFKNQKNLCQNNRCQEEQKTLDP